MSKIIRGIIAILFIGFGVWYYGFFDGDKLNCEEELLKHLKSPSSASIARGKTVKGDDKKFIEGVVDSDNSYGAKIRTSFLCSISKDNGYIITYDPTEATKQ